MLEIQHDYKKDHDVHRGICHSKPLDIDKLKTFISRIVLFANQANKIKRKSGYNKEVSISTGKRIAFTIKAL